MKEKSQIEKKAEEKQTELLSAALGGASNAGGHWLNVSGKGFPRLYPQGVSASPFNALFMALHSDNNGCKTNLFTLYSETKARGAAVREHEQGVPFLFYNWNKYVNRNNPNETIDRTAYLQLDEEQKAQFKGVHNREIRTLFNIDQTTLPYVDKPAYEDAVKQDGSVQERGYAEADNRRLRTRFNDFLLKMRDNLVPVRSDGSGVPHYETDKDAVYMPRQKDFEHYHDYVQEALRQIVSATGHQQRLAREGMVMKNGVAPSEDAVKYERLVVELASGIKMLELGLPARLSDASLKTVDYWCREFKENPCIMDALESDVNNALDVIRKAERGEKIEYATLRNRRQTTTMQEQMPKHYFVANEIRQHPDKAAKSIVLVIAAVGHRIKDIMVILILGMMFSSGVGAIVQILQYLSKEESLKAFVIWTMGSLGDVTFDQLAVLVPSIIAGLLLAVVTIKPLNLLLFGEEYAVTMGLNIRRSRGLLFLSTTLLAGTVTAFCGPIGFIGLAMPHVTRMLFRNSDHRVLVPGTVLSGAAVLLLCDLVSKMFTLPINAITALLGIPIVVWVVLRNKSVTA